MDIPRWALPVAALATAGMLLTACGGESPKQNVAAGSKQTAEPLEDPSADPSADVEATSLEVADDPELGKIVVDGEGNTLYRFDKDTADPPASNCNGACAKAWPPVTTSDDAAVKGLDADLVGTVKRSDGTEQVTLNGWPLYRYAKDESPGDTRGQGVQGTWFVSTPTGKKAGATPSPAPRNQNNGGGNGGRWTGKTTLKAVQNDRLGAIVVDGQGRTLYRFDKDVPKSGKSNCNGACAKAWPPVKFTANMTLTGIKGKVGNIMRADGVCQATLNGWPLYRYVKDQQAGDILGQGVQGTWFVSDPNGRKALGAGDADGGGNGGGGGGYGNGDGGYGY
ncbi:Secreted repeat of unknown function [Thermomonospora echinospora]|uniref:Lipoprotein with Yx(FWY)xxD motif n=1 Tax=Thermomonospora echinospora TaxID=1992 RepID=A0A1H6CL93_9ACTN|nr:hypothetical protein [Thermomonospora echinospora]SEG73216.1 Secreted repeat of unknown function [Thermomonospora echinospora]